MLLASATLVAVQVVETAVLEADEASLTVQVGVPEAMSKI